VLDISRLDAGAMKPLETVFEIGPLLKQIGTDFSPMASEKKLST
jgi:signal transduction histidine kinase